MLRPLPLFGNGSLPPAVWPRSNSRPIYQQIAPNRRSLPARNAQPLQGLEFTYIRCRRQRRAPSLPAVVEAAAPVRATSLRDTLAVPAMIANLGNHASRRLLEVLRWIAAGERGSSSRSLLICIWYAIHGERRKNCTAHPQHVRGGPMVRIHLPPAESRANLRQASAHSNANGSSLRATRAPIADLP
jgi:hypothetical protein